MKEEEEENYLGFEKDKEPVRGWPLGSAWLSSGRPRTTPGPLMGRYDDGVAPEEPGSAYRW